MLNYMITCVYSVFVNKKRIKQCEKLQDHTKK